MSTVNNGIYEFESEAEAILVLRAEGKRLLALAQKIWQQYESSYKPVQYVRTGKSYESIQLGEVKKLDEDTLGIELMFRDDLAYHPSVVTKGRPLGNSIMLISEGWETKRAKGYPTNPNNEYFPKGIHYFQGFNYLGKLEEAFNQGKHIGISFEIRWAGQKFEKKKKQPNVLRH
jgi:hypothetical protein